MTPNKDFHRIVTHAGMFHADEVLGRALTIALEVGSGAEFIRTNEVPIEFLLDSKTLVFDIGRQYDPLLGNFDHHHDPELPAACMLLLRHFYPFGAVRDRIENQLFAYVSKVDVGDIIEEAGEEFTVPTFNKIIRSLNSLGDFDLAVGVALPVLRSTIASCQSAVMEEEIWANQVEVSGGVAIYEGDAPLNTWRQLGKRDGAFLLLSPNRRGPGWRLESRDTNLYKIPEGFGGPTFRHNSGFVAVYERKTTALMVAALLMQANKWRSWLPAALLMQANK